MILEVRVRSKSTTLCAIVERRNRLVLNLVVFRQAQSLVAKFGSGFNRLAGSLWLQRCCPNSLFLKDFPGGAYTVERPRKSRIDRLLNDDLYNFIR